MVNALDLQIGLVKAPGIVRLEQMLSGISSLYAQIFVALFSLSDLT